MINKTDFDCSDIEIATSENTPKTTRTLQILNVITSIGTILFFTVLLPALHSNWLAEWRIWIVAIVAVGIPINFLIFEYDIRKAGGMPPPPFKRQGWTAGNTKKSKKTMKRW